VSPTVRSWLMPSTCWPKWTIKLCMITVHAGRIRHLDGAGYPTLHPSNDVRRVSQVLGMLPTRQRH
jgi:hypothetical protein